MAQARLFLPARTLPPEPPARPSVPLVTLCVVVAFEATLLIGVAGAYLVSVARGASGAPGTAAGIAGFGVVLASGLWWFAFALWRGQRWARGPLLTWQILQAATAVSLLSSPQWPIAATLLVLAVAAVVLLLVPLVVAGTARSRSAKDL